MNRTPRSFTGRRFRLLHASDLDSLPLCATCKEMERLIKDRAWADAGDDEWGFCGVGVYVSGEPMAYALVTPALYVPRRHPLSRGANADAAALLALYVEGAHPQHGLGKQAIQRLAAKLVDEGDQQHGGRARHDGAGEAVLVGGPSARAAVDRGDAAGLDLRERGRGVGLRSVRDGHELLVAAPAVRRGDGLDLAAGVQ